MPGTKLLSRRRVTHTVQTRVLQRTARAADAGERARRRGARAARAVDGPAAALGGLLRLERLEVLAHEGVHTRHAQLQIQRVHLRRRPPSAPLAAKHVTRA